MLIDNQYQVNCDVRNCTNKAQYLVETKGRLGRFFVCKQCLDTMLAEYAKHTTPKSPKNAIKKAMDNSTITEVKAHD